MRKKWLKGSENEFGIWPEERPALGSGSVPRYLQNEHRDERLAPRLRRNGLTVREHARQERGRQRGRIFWQRSLLPFARSLICGWTLSERGRMRTHF